MSPAIHGEGASTRCIFVTMLTSLQSFVGVLSASFCSAIIFAKIAKYQSIANVMFSDCVVIRFGPELMADQDLDDLGMDTAHERRGLKLPGKLK